VVVQTRDRKEDSENESNSSVIVKDDAFLAKKELDVVFHSVSSPHCHFAEVSGPPRLGSLKDIRAGSRSRVGR